MQCFTLPSRHPRLTTHSDYRAPPSYAYHQRAHFKPEPDKNGRMNNPDAYNLMPPLTLKSALYEPIDPKHRNLKMQEMLCHINKVNFTTSRDAKVRSLTSRVPFSKHFHHSTSMPTVVHTTYVDHGFQPVDRKFQTQEYALGVRPELYHVFPNTKERCVTRASVPKCLPGLTGMWPKRK